MGIEQKNQAGFATLEVILIVVVVTLVGVTGWFVLKMRSDNKPAQNAATSASSVSSAKSTTPAASGDDVQIKQAVKNYKDNIQFASIADITILGKSGTNAYGTVAFDGVDGGGQWLAERNELGWNVVSQGSLGICYSEFVQYHLPDSWGPPRC